MAKIIEETNTLMGNVAGHCAKVHRFRSPQIFMKNMNVFMVLNAPDM